MDFNFDNQPNPNNPALAQVIPGDLKSVSGGRRLKELGRYCPKCEAVTYINADTAGVCYEHQMLAFPCPTCGQSYKGESMRLKRGWIYESIDPSFNPQTAFLPAHHLPPSLQNERFVR